MRVLHVVESMGTGVLQVVKTLANGHAAAGLDVMVAYGARPETPSDLAGAFVPGVRLRPLPWRQRSPAEQARAWRALREVVTRFDPDVVHLHSSFAAALGMLAVRGTRRTIITPHAFASTMGNLSPRAARAVAAVEGELVRRCAVVGAVSHSEAAAARALGAPRVVTVENGIPELDRDQLRTRPRTTPSRPRVVAAGRIAPQRQPAQVAVVLNALRDIADVAWVGAAPPGSGYDAPLLAAKIPITGWVSRERAMAELEGADVYLHFTAWDGQAISLLEALAQDVAVVASDIPAAREVLPRAALAASPQDAIARIRTLLSDPEERAAHHAAQHAVRERYSAERMSASWYAIYRDVVAGRIPAQPLHHPDAAPQPLHA